MDIFDEAAKPDLQPLSAFLPGSTEFPAPLADKLRASLARDIDTTPQTIEAADRAQTQLTDLLLEHGHRAAAFLDVYHGITVAVIDALGRGVLTPKPFFVRLAGRFAERHFDGLKADLGLDTTSDAARYRLWRPSFAFDNLSPDAATPLATKPAMAHFTVGMCQHINFDLACALDETIRELRFAHDKAALEQIENGHNFVDTILAEKVERSTELLAAKFDCPMSKKIIESGGVKSVGEISMTMIRRWRAKTFVHALQLSSAPDEAARATIREQIYRTNARKTVRLFNTLPNLIEGTLRGTWFATS
ncbi:MAG TPA: DUF5995 family protein [Kofleriaceae bacterium]|nr:DUF5995 family protein [Kofleriaceae bacterium]